MTVEHNRDGELQIQSYFESSIQKSFSTFVSFECESFLMQSK